MYDIPPITAKLYGTLIVDEMVITVTDVVFKEQAIRLSGSIVANRVIAKGEVLTGIRVHGSDGSLITNIPEAELVMPDDLQMGGQLTVSIDIRMDNQFSNWEGQVT